MMNPGINLVMTVIGFAVSTMFIVFVCTRLICARIQLTASRRAFPTASRSELGLLERGCHGLEPVVISAFPTRKFSDGYFSSGEDAQVEKGKSFSSTWNSENDSGSCCPKLAYNGGALLPLLACVVMGGFKHLVLVRFKEGVVVEDIIRGMEKLATMDCIKSFEWGQDSGSEEMLRQGFTHAITLEFGSQEDFLAFSAHPDHLEYAGVFGASIEKIIVFDFTPVSVKARA